MNITEAFIAGLKKVNGAKRYVVLAFLINLAIAGVFGRALVSVIEDSLGSSIAGENMKTGFDGLWYGSFSSQATGFASTFDPSVTGIGAVFNGLDKFLSGNILDGYSGIITVGLLYLLLWTFFSGGFISIYAAKEERPSFFQQAARFFPRFVILAAISGVLYYLLFHFVFDWLTEAVDSLTRETVDERVHFTYTVLKYLILWDIIWFINLIFDYSKIYTVIHDHKNAFTAPLKAGGIVFKNLFRTYGLYLLTGLCWVLLMFVYWIIAPGAGQVSLAGIIFAFLVGQIYIICRISTRCLFYAGQTVMCSSISEPGE